jgi:hypothetical protein
MTAPALASRRKTPPLVRYNEMCRAITEAYEVDEVKDIRDQAIAFEIYARQAHNVEAERKACEIRLRAERKAGALSAKLEKAQGARRDRHRATMDRSSTKAEQLHAAGVSPRQAKNWEKLAAVPDKEFEAALADRTTRPSTNGIIKMIKPPKPNPVSKEALSLWGQLLDFERDGLLDKTPQEIMATMTPKMRDDVHAVAPRVAAWLKRIGAP